MLDWSPSKILRLENGQSGIAVSDLLALLAVYPGLESDRDELLTLAREARRPTVYNQYSDVFPIEFKEWMDYEAYADTIQQYENQLIPGVLQLDDYAVPLVTALNGGDEARAERIAEARHVRAEPLVGPDGPTMEFIIDETALRRASRRSDGRNGHPGLIAQLRHLIRVNTVGRRDLGETIEPELNPEISIQIVPLAMGFYLTMRQPFELIQFRGEDDPFMMFFEGPESDQVIRDKYEEIGRYVDQFDKLKKELAPPRETSAQIEHIIELLREGKNGLPLVPSLSS
jgi:hypothetical protein